MRRRADHLSERARPQRAPCLLGRRCAYRFSSPLNIMDHESVDITIVGAGPTGLFALFYAGMRGVSAQIVDALPEIGGQLTALYPEKYIFDVAGFSKVLTKSYVRAC